VRLGISAFQQKVHKEKITQKHKVSVTNLFLFWMTR